MHCPLAFRTLTPVAIILVAISLTHAADIDVTEAAAPATRATLKGMGTRKAVPDMVPASDEGLRALQRMKVPAGFDVKLWAAEPMLAKPVALTFDEKGRAFVAETHRYRSSALDIREYLPMLEDELAARTIEDRLAVIRKHFGVAGEKELSIETEVIRVLEDTDHDGIADKSAIYADGFNSALDGIGAGLLARRGSVWYTNIPSFWRLTGTAKAEQRTELSRGYGVRFNFVGHDMHGPTWGPDGKIYYSIGDRGAHVPTKEGGVVDVPDMGAVFRCKPDGSQLEVFAFGLRNPQALAFNEYGDLFTGDNDSDHGDEERLVHVVEDGDSGWRVGYQYAPLGNAGPWNSEKMWHPRHEGQPAFMLAPIVNIEDGPSGISFYPGTGFGDAYRGTLFAAHYRNGSLARSGIYAYQVKPQGASYAIADAKLFLGLALPTDVKFSPDGRLFFTDWADHWSRTYRGRVFAIANREHAGDALTRKTQELMASEWTKRPAPDLAVLLGHADWRVRLEAQFELAARGAESIPVLANAAQHGVNPPARRHAIWALGQIAETAPAALAPVRTLLRDPEPDVRAQSFKVLGDCRSQPDTLAMIAALEDADNRVKFFAAQSLGKIRRSGGGSELRERATSALHAALRTNNDRDNYLRHALVMALAGNNDAKALAAAATDSAPAVRLGALLALRRLQNAEVARFLGDAVPAIAREAALAINDAPIPAAFPALAARLEQSFADEPVYLRAINAHFRLGQPADATALAQLAANPNAPAKARTEALTQLGLWAKPPARDRIVGVFRPLPTATRDRAVAIAALQPHLDTLLGAGAPAPVQTAALKTLQDLEVNGAADALFAAVRNEKLAGSTRASALVTLEKLKDPRLADAVKIAGASSSPPLRLAALPIAARLSPDLAMPVLENLARSGTPEEQRTAFGALANSKHPRTEALFVDQLQRLAAGKIGEPVQLDLLLAANRRPEPAIKALLVQREAALAADPDPLAAFRVALMGGNRARGLAIFRSHPALPCIQCHRAGDDGGDAGPDLAGVGARHPREYLLEAVLKPNATIAEGFNSVVLTLKNGDTAVGVLLKETPETLTLRRGDGTSADVRVADITKRENAPSGMPEVYATLLTKSEVRDVVEFLASLRDRGAPPLEASPPRALRGLAAVPPPAPKGKKKRK